MSLEWLVASFLQQHPQILDRQLTTAQVVFDVVKPATLQRQCRYTDLVDMRGSLSSGKDFYFVSHGWARPFSELVQQLMQHFSPDQQLVWRRGGDAVPWSEVYVWLDVFGKGWGVAWTW